MKINGLTIFSLVLGTFSLSLTRNKRQADLTENVTALPSADIAKRYADAYRDPHFSVYSTETNIQTPDAIENRDEQNFSHLEQQAVRSSFSESDPQQNYNTRDDQTDSSTITTMRPRPPPSYFARFITRRNTEKEYNSEVDNENSHTKHVFYEDWSNSYCTEKIQGKNNDDERTKVNDSESENFTEKTLNFINTHEEATDISEYKNTQETCLDNTEVESSGQVVDSDNPTCFHLDLESMLIDKTKSKRELPLYQNTIEEAHTSLPQVDVDYSDQQSDEKDYEQSLNDVGGSNYMVRLLYGLSYLYSVIRGSTSNATKMVIEFFN